MATDATNHANESTVECVESRTELDSHANMPVVGANAYILAETGKRVDVSPFTPDYKPITAPLVDAALQYDCPYDGKSYVLVLRNSLHVPSMVNNLIPPFMLREAGVKVNEIPKIQVDDPTEDDHAITFPETGFRIPLALWGIFSYFPTTKPTQRILAEPPDVYLLTPTRWNPHSDVYAYNEEAMLDWEGNMRPPKDRERRVVLDQIPEDDALVSSLCISASEEQAVDRTFPDDEQPLQTTTAAIADLDLSRMASMMDERAQRGIFMMNIGSTYATTNVYVEDSDSDGGEDGSESMTNDSSAPSWIKRDDSDSDYESDGLDEMMAAATAGQPSGVTPEALAKVWRISVDDARRTIETTSQNALRKEDPTLSRNYGTNDRMLRYKRIREHFFMDTFFATKKGGKSS